MPFRQQPAPRIMPRRGLFYALTAFRQVTSAHNSSQQPARLRSGFGQFGLSHQYSDRNINPAPQTHKPPALSLVRNGAQQLRQAALYRAIHSRYRAAQFDLQFSGACRRLRYRAARVPGMLRPATQGHVAAALSRAARDCRHPCAPAAPHRLRGASDPQFRRRARRTLCRN